MNLYLLFFLNEPSPSRRNTSAFNWIFPPNSVSVAPRSHEMGYFYRRSFVRFFIKINAPFHVKRLQD